ncbi:MAG: 60S ribosomal protein L31 [Theionarchaea archaeon]|nr:MAG: 50S ribosomal protein L31 [Theionarchaea archaeon DG-70]MBU7012525.1 60S ribosomal protein L31 [Theionarchaea archaeon]
MEEGDERVYVIPLRHAKRAPRRRRAPRAINELRSFLQQHTKVDSIVISQGLNEWIWSRGIQKPPPRVRVKAVKVVEDEQEFVIAELAE